MLTIVRQTNQDQLLKRAARVLCEKTERLLAEQNQANLAIPGGRSVSVIFQVR